MPMKVRDWKPVNKGNLVGWAEIEFPSGMVVHSIGVFTNAEGQLYAMPPSRPRLDRDGRQQEREGKKQYEKLLSFTSREIGTQWSDIVLRTLQAEGKL
jgi:DNA-binding cell septation regulator SpoVG